MTRDGSWRAGHLLYGWRGCGSAGGGSGCVPALEADILCCRGGCEADLLCSALEV